MILNGYDTIVGSKFKRTDNIDSTLKSLSTTNKLQEIHPSGVFGVNHETGFEISPFVFPITVTNYRGNTVTIFDQRHYLNSKGSIVNGPEYNMMYVASVIQQQIAEGKRSILSSSEFIITKAFSKSVGELLSRDAGLNLDQSITLQIILAHYFVCLQSNPTDDFIFISANIINKTLKYSQMRSLPIIEAVGFIPNLTELINVLKTFDQLPTLSKLDIGAFISIVNRTWFVTSGFRMLIGAAIELPHLYTAVCYATATNNIYKTKTKIGKILERRETPEIDAFVKVIDSNVY